MESGLLGDIVVIFVLSILVAFICHRMRIPTIVGFLFTGVLAGPHGLKLVSAVHEVESLAEIGVILLLFTIGMEFSFKNLLQIKRSVVLGGSLQVALSIGIGLLAVLQFHRTFGTALFAGFLLCLSSTAIVLKILQEQAAVDSPQGRTTLAVLIFQDVIVVPMMLVTPVLAGAEGLQGQSGLMLAAKGIAVVALVIAGAKWLVPYVLYRVAATRNRELFMITVVAICLAVAWLTNQAGLSLALGAFMAGLIISESQYSHQAIGNILPMRDIFGSFFFVSIGMLLDLKFLVANPVLVLLAALAVLTAKTITGTAAAAVLRFPLRVALPVGLALSQIGEFSFILSRNGLLHGLLTERDYQIMLNVSVLTMAVTPIMMTMGKRFAQRSAGARRVWNVPGSEPASQDPTGRQGETAREHVIVVGFGVNGRNVTRACAAAGISYTIIEMNPETVRTERKRGEPILYGDAVNDAVLEHAGIHSARVLVLTLADPVGTRHVTANAKVLNPKIYVIARTRFLQEINVLKELGADEVIPEEYETAVEIFARVLRRFFVPQEEIHRLVAELRSEGYEMLRGLAPDRMRSVEDLSSFLSDVDIATYRVKEKAALADKGIGEVGLRKNYGVTVLAIRRSNDVVSDPRAETVLLPGDLAVVMGHPARVAAVAPLFQGTPENN